MKIIIEPLRSRAAPKAVALAYASTPDSAILESSRAIGPFARYSIFAKDPVREVCIRNHADQFESLVNTLTRELIHIGDVAEKIDSVPFVGGWIGYLSYDAAIALSSRGSGDRGQPTAEAMGMRDAKNCPSPGRGDRSASFLFQPENDTNSLPLAHFRLYDTVAIYDHVANFWNAVAIDWPPDSSVQRPTARKRIDELLRTFDEIERHPDNSNASCNQSLTFNNDDCQNNLAASDWSHDEYLRAVERVLKYIADGDAYQINLAQRFSIETDLTPAELYLRLRERNPSSHAAFLTTQNAAIISSSPELFLNLRNGQVTTRPIKGTRPRGDDQWSDQTNRDELESSEKDHAELAMIVDLMRNDLGRVCEFGTVRVSDPGTIETLPTVFHRTATVEGRLRDIHNWCDLLRATFPGGSITGAPKIRAMQIIDELEPVSRGVYCGSMGYIGLDGSMQMNIAIRTMTQIGRTVHIHAGSGIVADSEPEAEHAEILAKARAMFEAVGCESPQSVMCTGVAP